MIAWVAIAGAQEVSGFAEVRLQGYAGIEADVPLLVVERFRPTFSAPLTDRIQLTTTIEAGLSQGWRATDALADVFAEAGLPPQFADAFAIDERDNRGLAVSKAGDYLAVDRLALEIYTPAADARLGRQALNWGSAFAVNPSDPFPEVLLTEPWKPRSGVNALRVDIPFGDLNSLILVAGSDDAFLHPRLAGRVTVNLAQTDWSLVGAWREEADEGIAGIDIKGTLGVGFWFEGVVHISDDPYEEFAAGLDYSFPVLEQLIVTGQYYRNGSGTVGGTTPSILDERRPFAPAFSGRDYGMFSVSAGFTPEVAASALWIQNLDDGSAFVVPTVTVFPTDAFEISLAAQLPLALSGGGEFKPSDEQLTIDLPLPDSTVATVDLDSVTPDATVILWSRFNF